jgi:hypothetical protein
VNKQQHFIIAVQTGVIIRSTLEPRESPVNTMYHAMGLIDEAVRAASRIPEELSANEAACEILGYLYDMPHRESDPDSWFMRS